MKPMTSIGAASLLAAMLIVAGCGGGSNSPVSGGSANGPTISAIRDQTVAQDASTNPIVFTVTDPDSDLSSLKLSAQASDSSLILPDGISLSGTGAMRSITITPNERTSGTAQITITVTDPQGSFASQSFNLQVTTTQVSFKDFATQTVAADENTQPQSIAGLSFTQDADDPSAFSSLVN